MDGATKAAAREVALLRRRAAEAALARGSLEAERDLEAAIARCLGVEMGTGASGYDAPLGGDLDEECNESDGDGEDASEGEDDFAEEESGDDFESDDSASNGKTQDVENEAAAECSNSLEGEPPHFSRIGSGIAADSDAFPDFSGVRRVTAKLRAGDALYLPCGWWHEVFSSSGDERGDFHMAVNYWFHPPDLSEDVSASSPYISRLWPDAWELRTAGLDLDSQPHSESLRKKQRLL